MRKIPCPAGGWIGLPDEWLGSHALRQDEARKKAETLPGAFQTWAVALALLEDWGELPGLDGRPESWDFSQKSWPLMNWIAQQVLTDLSRSLRVPKAPSARLPDGSKAATLAEMTPGDLSATA